LRAGFVEFGCRDLPWEWGLNVVMRYLSRVTDEPPDSSSKWRLAVALLLLAILA
jgi:hypothetical protein